MMDRIAPVSFHRYSDGPQQDKRTGWFNIDGSKIERKTLGHLIKTHRMQRGITLEALATLSGTSKGHLWGVENDRVPNPSFALVMSILSALHLNANDVWLATIPAPAVKPEPEGSAVTRG